MLKKLARKMHRDERGITGLETAIILIAFVVVASVFAYTVLSAGIFSSQKGQEAVYTGLEQARSTVELKGDVVAKANATAVQELIFSVGNALDGEAIDLTDTTGDNVTVISYSSSGDRTEQLRTDLFSFSQGIAIDTCPLLHGDLQLVHQLLLA